MIGSLTSPMLTEDLHEINHSPQVLIIGTGIAGLFSALKLAHHAHVTLVCKLDVLEGNTRYAQGGIASVWSQEDSFEEHLQDTLNAGAGLCRKEGVEICVQEGPERVRELIEFGVQFTQNEAHRYDLHHEGGHGKRRILHADDLTGLAIVSALLKQAKENPNITILEYHAAIDLITEGKLLHSRKNPDRCLGAYVLNIQTRKVLTLSADITFLATGGAGKVYLYTSNPDTATGDGIAMAYRIGAQIANLEMIQFHPTCLYHPNARTYLISEALRGEGAFLKTLDGREFMDKYHPMGSLAPRDIVARAIDLEMKRSGDKCVLLDCSKISPQNLKSKFPNIHETCLKYGIDITQTPIPVVPAAHYICGGISVNNDAQTSIQNLYAIGETACTGVHGANRLASNSLLEAIVFSHRAVQSAIPLLSKMKPRMALPQNLPVWDAGKAVPLEEQIDIASNWLEVRSLMWNYVGIVRSNRRLERAKKRLELIKSEVNHYYWNYLLTKDLIELRNLVTVAELIVQSAMLRKESRGLHYTIDYPNRDDKNFSKDSVL